MSVHQSTSTLLPSHNSPPPHSLITNPIAFDTLRLFFSITVHTLFRPTSFIFAPLPIVISSTPRALEIISASSLVFQTIDLRDDSTTRRIGGGGHCLLRDGAPRPPAACACPACHFDGSGHTELPGGRGAPFPPVLPSFTRHTHITHPPCTSTSSQSTFHSLPYGSHPCP